MKTPLLALNRILLASTLAFAPLAFGDPQPPARPSLVHAPLPAFPDSLKNQPIYQGSALVGCIIDSDGSVVEVWSMEASHTAFANSAEAAVREWRYAKAADSEKPAIRTDAVQIHFSLSGALVSQTQFEASKSLLNGHKNQLPPVYDQLPAGSRRPALLEGTNPKPVPGRPGGAVDVEFFVDSEGRVRLPLALRSSDPALAEAAVSAVRRWRFEAPRVEDKPASLRMRWSFKFPSRET